MRVVKLAGLLVGVSALAGAASAVYADYGPFVWPVIWPGAPEYPPAEAFGRRDGTTPDDPMYDGCNWNGRPRNCIQHVYYKWEVIEDGTRKLFRYAPRCAMVYEKAPNPGTAEYPDYMSGSDGTPVNYGSDVGEDPHVVKCDQYPLAR